MKNISPALEEKLLGSGWLSALRPFFESDEYAKIIKYLSERSKEGVKILPNVPDVFRAFLETPFDKTKVVFLGTEPYATPRLANGLAYGVNVQTCIPPVLNNIFKELYSDIEATSSISAHSMLHWAHQGCLMLNGALTVEMGAPGSHFNLWQPFTDHVIKTLSDSKTGLVFVLWGDYAKSKKTLIKIRNHYIVEAASPHQITASNGFFGSKPFRQINAFLRQQKEGDSIEWSK